MTDQNIYDVVVKHMALKGFDLTEATNNFLEKFEDISEAFGGESYDSKNEIVVASEVNIDEAERIRKKVEDIGLLTHARHRDGYDGITPPFLGAIPIEEYALNRVYSESTLIEAIKGGLFQGASIKGRWFIEKNKSKYQSRNTQSSTSPTSNVSKGSNSRVENSGTTSDAPLGIIAIICAFGILLPIFGYFFLPIAAILGVLAINKGQTTSGGIAIVITIIMFILIMIGTIQLTKEINEADRELRDAVENIDREYEKNMKQLYKDINRY